MPRARTRDARRPASKLSLVLSIVLFLLGATFIFYPALSSIAARGESDAALSKMRSDLVEGSGRTASEDGVTYRAKDNDPTYLKLQQYNEAVRTGKGETINDPFAFSGGDLTELGLPDGIIGSITIPNMSVILPLYLGATDEHMGKGAGVIAGTSMPLGEMDSNTVVAAHRGALHGLLMFRNIENMRPGDQVVVETPWERIVYETVSTKVIDKADAGALDIQPGHDMLTLFTCHPYGQNSHRYLVYCEKTDAKPVASDAGAIPDAITGFLPPTGPSASPMLVAEGWLRIAGLVLTILCGVAIMTSTWRLCRQALERHRGQQERPPAAPPFRSSSSAAFAPRGSSASRAPAVAARPRGRAAKNLARPSSDPADPGRGLERILADLQASDSDELDGRDLAEDDMFGGAGDPAGADRIGSVRHLKRSDRALDERRVRKRPPKR